MTEPLFEPTRPVHTGAGAILGVDPGSATGALALLDAATGDLLWVEDTPTIEGNVPAPLVADLLVDVGIVEAWVERAQFMPGQGGSSSFKYGASWGVVLGVLGGARIPTVWVAASKWKNEAKLPGGKGKDKGLARERAIRLWPEHSASFRLVKHHGRADAALIARHGWVDWKVRHG